MTDWHSKGRGISARYHCRQLAGYSDLERVTYLDWGNNMFGASDQLHEEIRKLKQKLLDKDNVITAQKDIIEMQNKKIEELEEEKLENEEIEKCGAEIANLRAIERDQIKTIDNLEKQNSYASTWMDKYHRAEKRNAELEKGLDDSHARGFRDGVIASKQKLNRYREALEEYHCGECARVGECEYDDCPRSDKCNYLKNYIKALAEGKE